MIKTSQLQITVLYWLPPLYMNFYNNTVKNSLHLHGGFQSLLAKNQYASTFTAGSYIIWCNIRESRLISLDYYICFQIICKTVCWPGRLWLHIKHWMWITVHLLNMMVEVLQKIVLERLYNTTISRYCISCLRYWLNYFIGPVTIAFVCLSALNFFRGLVMFKTARVFSQTCIFSRHKGKNSS